MGIIVPAILPRTRAEFERELSRFAPLIKIENIQLDVVDGRFAAPASWPYADATHEFAAMVEQGEMLPSWERYRYDIDLMVERPEESIGAWVLAGAARLTIHIESTSALPDILADLKRRWGHDREMTPGLLAVGLALNVETDPALLEPCLSFVEYVQFMGIAHIGRQGEPFDERVLARVRAFHGAHPEVPIQIDGGVSLHTAPALLKAGASRLVVGSALSAAEDPSAELEKFDALAQEYGMYA